LCSRAQRFPVMPFSVTVMLRTVLLRLIFNSLDSNTGLRAFLGLPKLQGLSLAYAVCRISQWGFNLLAGEPSFAFSGIKLSDLKLSEVP